MSAAGGRRLILLEDHVADLSRHRDLAAAGYRIIRRYENKRLVGSARFHCWGPMVGPMGGPAQLHLALPFRVLRKSVAPHSQADHFVPRRTPPIRTLICGAPRVRPDDPPS